MWNFLIILAVFLGIDVLYLSIWTGFFQFRRELSREEVRKRREMGRRERQRGRL